MSSIIICEKGSQVAIIRRAVGETYGPIYPASGHLYTLAEPDEYSDEWKNRRGFHVYRPVTWLKVPTVGRDADDQKRLDQARAAIKAALKKARKVYIATDCDREGEVIGRELLDIHGYAGEARRVIFNADDPESVKEAFSGAVPIAERDLIYQSGLARERADFIWNLSLTRAVTTALMEPGHSGVIGVGRVKTPTLGIVCRRELQITEFKPSDSHIIRLTLDTPAGPVTLTSSAELVFADKASAEAPLAQIMGQEATIAVEVTRKKQGPPKPPDLTTLQIIANRWGWPADKTLDIGQSLYSKHTLITYIRASARYYPEPMAPLVPAIIAALGTIPALTEIVPGQAVIRTGKSGTFSDEGLKGESHYAIMPNPKTVDRVGQIVLSLTPDEAKLFDLVCRCFLQTLMPDHEYEQIKITAEVAGIAFAGNQRRPISAGWRLAQAGDMDEAPDETAPELETALAPGAYRISKAEARPKQATAPRRYNQGSLISAMINAWQFVRDADRRARLRESKGIGTVATRDTMIRGLLDQGQLAETKTAIAPTKAGLELFAVLYRIDPRLVDPGTTAEWELNIDEIARGNLALDAFLDGIEAETARLVSKVRQEKPQDIFGAKQPPTPSMVKAIEAIQKAKGLTAPVGWRGSFSAARAFIEKNGAKANAK